MNYKELYSHFIESWKDQTFEDSVVTEVHHIIPRHCGGEDNEENLIKLSYRQHTFAHKLLWKAYGRPQDELAYRLMSGISEDKLFECRSMAGKVGGAKNRESGHIANLGKTYGSANGRRCAENGHMDKIRLLVDKDIQREAARKTGLANKENGTLERALKAAWKANSEVHGRTPERVAFLRQLSKDYYSHEHMVEMNKKAAISKGKAVEDFWKYVVETSPRNEEYLNMEPTSRTKFWCISPEGHRFISAMYAAKYYGCDISRGKIEQWVKFGKLGWHRIPIDS